MQEHDKNASSIRLTTTSTCGTSPIISVRKGLQIVRDVLGPDKYINTSWGIPTPLEGVVIVNGSRCWDDTESMAHVVSTVVVPQTMGCLECGRAAQLRQSTDKQIT